MAAYGALLYNVMDTALCNPGQVICDSPTVNTLIVVQIATVAETMTHGEHARHSELPGERVPGMPRSPNANWGSGIGCHHRNSKSVMPVDVSDESTSVSGYVRKFEHRNCITAKLAPATASTGQTARTDRTPP